jgi:hypothetical protein
MPESAATALTDAIRDHRELRAVQFVIKHLSAAARRKCAAAFLARRR